MKSPLALLLTVVVLLATGLLANKMLLSEPKPVRGYLDLISLNAEQKRKVEEIRKDFLPKITYMRQELRGKRLQLNDLIFASKSDLKAIDDKTREIAGLQSELEKKVVNHILQEKELLNPEQREQFYEIIKKEFGKGGLGVHDERSK